MNLLNSFIAFLLIPISPIYTQNNNIGNAVIEGTETFDLYSDELNRNYFIKVKLPMKYDSLKYYPILFVIDAETNFGGVTYITQRLMKDDLIPEIIVVGIAYKTDYTNFYRLRGSDLTSVKGDGRMRNFPAGDAEKFSQFIQHDVFTAIGKKYSVNQNDRAIYGHSLGGLFGYYLFLNRPKLFNRYLLLSPSLWWGCKDIFNSVHNISSFDRTIHFYSATGELENGKHHCNNESMVDHQNEMIHLFKNKNLAHVFIKSEILSDETHRSIFGRGFTNGLRFIYKVNDY